MLIKIKVSSIMKYKEKYPVWYQIIRETFLKTCNYVLIEEKMFLFPIKVTIDDVVYKINGNLTNSFYYITNSFYYTTKIFITN